MLLWPVVTLYVVFNFNFNFQITITGSNLCKCADGLCDLKFVTLAGILAQIEHTNESVVIVRSLPTSVCVMYYADHHI